MRRGRVVPVGIVATLVLSGGFALRQVRPESASSATLDVGRVFPAEVSRSRFLSPSFLPSTTTTTAPSPFAHLVPTTAPPPTTTTTAPPPTTTTTRPRPTTTTTHRPTTTTEAAPAADDTSSGELPAGLVCIRGRESGGNYATNTGNGYYGAYQYDISTWGGYGGYRLPSSAPPSVQDDKALQGYNAGPASRHHLWPNTSRACGV